MDFDWQIKTHLPTLPRYCPDISASNAKSILSGYLYLEMGTYRKSIEEGTFQRRFYETLGFPPISHEDGTPLVLRITLGDMELINGFYISLPADTASLSIEDAIRKHILCESEEDRFGVKQKIARQPNPDLLDIYDDLLFLYQQAEAGRITFSYNINYGASDIQPTDPVSLHQRTCTTDDGRRQYMLLDLILEVHDNLDPFSGLTDDQKDAMLKDFRGIFILYLMDKFGSQPNGIADLEHLAAMLEYLASEDVGLLCLEGEYFITPRGHDLLNRIADEAEYYIDNYDIFGDVYVKGVSEIRFSAGYGDNLVMPVFMRGGIDPYRALFVVALYLGNMDYLASDPATLFSEAPFKELFSLIPYSPTEEEIGAELLDRIIREGNLKVEKQKLREARLKHIEQIERRISSSH